MGTTPRSSHDSKDSGVVKGSQRPSFPSPVAEEAEWASGAGTPLQKGPSKPFDLTIKAAPGNDPIRRLNDNEALKQLVSGKSKQCSSLTKTSSSSPDLSHMRVTDYTDVRNSFSMGPSRRSLRSSKDKRCPDVRQAQDHLLVRSSQHTSITVDSDEVQSVWL